MKARCKDRCDMLGVCRDLPDCELPPVPPTPRYIKEGAGQGCVAQGQSHAHTTAEVTTNIVLGFGISVAITAVLLPAMGHQVTLTENVAMTCVFTVASFARAYGLRRLFNWLQLRQNRSDK
jgi:hypothetical protein